MNYFIDFDNTLYNTPLLANDMLVGLSKYISDECNKNYDDVFITISNKFGRGEKKIFDIYDLITYFAQNEYHYNEEKAIDIINKIISDGMKNLYDDSIPFLKALKQYGHKIYILSYHENRVYFQTVKIAGSGLLKYVDGTMITTTMKGNMPFKFSECVFIDDNPRDLASIYKNNPYQIFRIRREKSTYSNIETNLSIPELASLEELMQKKFLWRD